MGLVRKPSWSGRYLPDGAVGMTVAPVRALRSGRIVSARRGMGADLRTDPVTGASIDCDAWGNFFNSTCWGVLTQKGQQSYAYGDTPYLSTTGSGVLPVLAKGATAPVIVAGTVSTLPAGSQDNPDALVAQQIAAQQALNQAANQQFFVDLTQQVAQNSGCTQRIFSGVCDWITLAAGAVLGVGLLMAFQGGRR